MKLLPLPLLLLLLLLFPIITLAGEPPANPFIRINTEMHSAIIKDISSDPDGKLLATASFDKSVKIWNADTGRLIRTIRPPIGSGNEGTLNSVAISPDGKSVATGGNTGKSWDKGYSVYIFDLNSGEMTHHIRNLPQFIYRLAYSPDGSRLAVAFNNSRGVSVFSTSDYRHIWSDASIKGNCYGIDFDKSGNLAVSSDEGIFKMYRPDGALIYEQTTEEGKNIFTLSFSPDGKFIALGFDDYNAVEVRHTSDGTLAFLLEKPKGNWAKGVYSTVAWTSDGLNILAAGLIHSPDKRRVLTRWSVNRKILDEQMILPVKNNITQLLPLKNGSIVFLSRLSGFGAISNGGRGKQITLLSNSRKKIQFTEMNTNGGGLNFYNPQATADFRMNHDAFKIAADASSVLFSYERQGQAMAAFDMKKRGILKDNISEKNFISPRVTGNGVDVQNWENWGKQSLPLLNSKELKGFWSREVNWSLAVSHDDSSFVLGSNMNIRSYSKSGKLLWQKRVPGVAWDVNISADNRTLVAALDDSTIRWYRMKDGQELYALYLHPDRKRWVLWLPDGFFDHGPESDELIGFLVNRGVNKSSVMIGVDQMYDIFYRPDIVDRAIAGEDVTAYLQKLTVRSKTEGKIKVPTSVGIEKPNLEKVAVEKTAPDENNAPLEEPMANDDPATATQNKLLGGLLNSATLPPKVRFISKSGSSESRDFNLKAELCDNGGGIGNVTLFMNNTPIAFESGDRGLAVRNKTVSADCQNFERMVTLSPGQNIISLMAYNSGNSIESDRDQLTLNYKSADTEKPRLHILTIAVNSYRDGDLRLKYSLNDAEGVIKMASEKAGALYSGIDTYRLHDEQVTREKMEAIFTQIGARTKRGDVFLLFMAGHGITDDTDGMYYFLPVNFRYTGQESIAGQGISMNDFKRFLVNIKAMKTLLLIDTCNSGSFSEAVATRGVSDKTAITKLARAVGRATIAASSKNQVALEGYEGHGVFSYTLLEGMNGKAADKKGEISVNRLATFIEETLPELTFKKWGYEQIPQKSLIGSDFQIGVK